MADNGLQAVIFDLDGTLVSAELDFDAIRAEIGGIRGPILEHIERMDENGRRRANDILERHERAAAERCVLNDGTLEMLQFLRDSGLRLGLLTRNTRASVDTVCRRLGLEFDTIVAREDAPPKPSPEPVWLACRNLNVAPERALVVGDYVFDIQSGFAAGAWTALLCARNRPLPKTEAHFEIATLTQLREIVPLLQECQDREK